MLTIYDLVNDAKEEFWNRIKELDNINSESIEQLIFDVADANVPLYTREILEVAQSDINLLFIDRDLWLDCWNSKPLDIIRVNIFEYIRSKLTEQYNKD